MRDLAAPSHAAPSGEPRSPDGVAGAAACGAASACEEWASSSSNSPLADDSMSALPLPALLLLEEVRLGWLDDPVSDVYLRTRVSE